MNSQENSEPTTGETGSSAVGHGAPENGVLENGVPGPGASAPNLPKPKAKTGRFSPIEQSEQPLIKPLWQLRLGERRSLLIFGDFLVGLISLFLSLYYWGSSERLVGFSTEFLQKRVPIWFYALPLIWLVLMVDNYDVHRAADFRKTVRSVLFAAAIGLVLYLLLYFYYTNPPKSMLPRLGVASYLISASILTLAWRWLYIRVFTAPQFLRRVLLVGGGVTGQRMLEVFNLLKVKPFVLTGIIDDDQDKIGAMIAGHPVIGTSEQLLEIISANHVDDLIVAITGEMQLCMFQALLNAQEKGVELFRMPTLYEDLLSRVPVLSLEADWIVRSFVDDVRVSGFFEFGKRLLDILGGVIGILGLLIVLPFVALMIVSDDGLPVFYDQTRAGRRGQPYKIIKFRTMRKDAEADGKARWAKEDDLRATRIGRFLRKTHLDELPQIINVLRGEMSLVGPRAERPELMHVFEKHIPFYRARLLVKPGITGWAQVNFGYAATVEETLTKLEYDLYYIKHRGLLLDLIILLRTPAMVLGLRGR
jgi:exopolysaccharide biosynthesis polyprenyl glycosylphosphotransferase